MPASIHAPHPGRDVNEARPLDWRPSETFERGKAVDTYAQASSSVGEALRPTAVPNR